MTNTIESVSQEPNPGEFVWLFTLDATAIGGGTYRFTPSSPTGVPLVFDGNEYTPIKIEANGFAWNGKGAPPQPRLKISNVTKLMLAAVITYRGLKGATVTRIRTFGRFLDGAADADPTAIYTTDVYTVDRVMNRNKSFIEWGLRAAIDQEGQKIPARTCVRDYCDFIYRTEDPENPGTFLYDADYPCPYVGTDMFDREGNVVTDASQDACSHMFGTGCKLRFPTGRVPFGGFIGIARTRL